jgi:hypothetical protein
MPIDKRLPKFFPPVGIPGLTKPTLAERWALLQHFGVSSVFGVYSIPEAHIGYGLEQDPLFSAIEGIATERANAAAQIVVQGTLAYAHVEEFPYAVERYIPIDIYSEGQEPSDVGEVVVSLNNLFRQLGFNVVTHPNIAISSTHSRAVIQTRRMTPEELQKLEGLYSKALEHLDTKKDHNSADQGTSDDLENQKTLEEIIKLQVEVRKIETVDTKLAQAQIKQAEEETKKAIAERVSAATDAFNKLASALLKISVAVTLLIGGISLASTPPDGREPAPHATTQVKKADKTSNIKRLGDFLEKLAAQEEAAKKLAGGE